MTSSPVSHCHVQGLYLAAFLLRLFMKRNKHLELHLFQFKWNINHFIPELKSKVHLNLSQLFQLFQLFHSLNTLQAPPIHKKLLHSTYYSSIPPLPFPKNCQKECSLSEFWALVGNWTRTSHTALVNTLVTRPQGHPDNGSGNVHTDPWSYT